MGSVMVWVCLLGKGVHLPKPPLHLGSQSTLLDTDFRTIKGGVRLLMGVKDYRSLWPQPTPMGSLGAGQGPGRIPGEAWPP